MKSFSPVAVGLAVLLFGGNANRVCGAATASTPAAKKFEEALKRTENLNLPLNRAYLYRQAAAAVAQKDTSAALVLLRRALADIDAAEAAMRARGVADAVLTRQLAMGRRATILQLLRLDPAEALRLLARPQPADTDIGLQRQIFERLSGKDLNLARDLAVRKLDFGVTPAVVAAYEVLRRHDAAAAGSLATSLVARLETIDPARDPVATESAFTLLGQQRNENADRELKVNAAASLLDADSLKRLYEFLGDALLEAQDPQALTLKEKPAAYMAALQQYAPEKADQLTQALVASSKAPNTAPSNGASADPADAETLTPEEQKRREAARVAVETRLASQVRETSAHIRLLTARIGQTTLTQKERDDAVFAVVEEANRSLSLGRALAADLEPEAFRNGELEFSAAGQLNGVVESASSILQRYAMERPGVAEDAAITLDGPEVQTEVELQIAIREMIRGEGFVADRDRQRHRIEDEPQRSSF